MDRILFVEEDIRDFVPKTSFDAALTPFVLDCFTNDQLVELGLKMISWLVPKGILLFSDFHESGDPNQSSRFSRPVTRVLYYGLNLICGLKVKQLPNFNLLFEKLPLILVEKRLFFRNMMISSAYRLDQKS